MTSIFNKSSGTQGDVRLVGGTVSTEDMCIIILNCSFQANEFG